MDGKQRKITKSHKEKISKSNKGKRNAIETEFKIGHKVSDAMRRKISIRTKKLWKILKLEKRFKDTFEQFKKEVKWEKLNLEYL